MRRGGAFRPLYARDAKLHGRLHILLIIIAIDIANVQIVVKVDDQVDPDPLEGSRGLTNARRRHGCANARAQKQRDRD